MGARETLLPLTAFASALPLLILVIISLVALVSGGSDVGLHSLLFTLDRETVWMILGEIRLPRLILAALCGGSFSLASVVSQGLFRNPLASPSILGVSGGGTLAVVLGFYFLESTMLAWFGLPLLAMFGCGIVSIGFILYLQRSSFAGNEQLLILGFALSTLFASITSFFLSITLEDMNKTQKILHWLLGSFQGKGWREVGMCFPWVLVGILWAFRLTQRLDILTLGEEVAQTLDVDVPRLQKEAVMVLSLLVGGSVCVVGVLPFLGLIVTHICRKLGAHTHKSLGKLALLYGMSFAIASDLLARTLRYPVEIEVGIITSILGAVFFIGLFLRRG